MAWRSRKGGRGARRWPLATSAAVLLAAAGAGSAVAAGSSAQRVRVGHLPALASAARVVGALPASVRMHVTIVLKPQHPRALAAYARAVSTPGSRSYHAYLTPNEFAARFGASTGEVLAVQRSMRMHGLIAGRPTANRLAVPLTGSAGQIERAFSILFRRVATRHGTAAVVASAAPALDSNIAGDVQAVLGLTSVAAPRPLLERGSAARHVAPRARSALHAAGDGPQPCAGASAAASSQHAYTDDQVASAYGLNNLYADGAEGQGQTIAVYELESYSPGDIASYQSCYGTAASISNISVDGGAGSGPGAGEAALDIEQVVGFAPKANILVYEGPNSSTYAPGSGPYDTLDAIVAGNRAHVVSISWGNCEEAQGTDAITAENTLLEEAATQGQSVVSATGDEGSEDCLPQSDDLAVDDPGSQSFVTAVGGTSLQAAGPPPTETVWNSGSGPPPAGAGGGGVSHAWQMPGYQLNAAKSLNVLGPYSSGSPCGNSGGHCRQVPDVAADADPDHGYEFYFDGDWGAVGGTSAAAPVWAAMLADANSSRICHGSAIGFADPALYHAADTAYGSYFNDVTTGNNDFTGGNGGLYPARSGYDMASGLGSPKAGALAAALCADSLRVNNPGRLVSTVGYRVSLRITTTTMPGSHLKFYASHLPPGLSISRSTGRITGRPKRIGTWLTGVAALDQNLSLRGTFFHWHVGGPPTVSGMTLSGVAAGDPRLTFTLTAGRAAAWLKVISIRLFNGLKFVHAAGRVRLKVIRSRRVTFSSTRVGGRLRIAVTKPVWRVRVTVEPGAIRDSAALAADVRAHQPPRVTITVMTTDASRHRVTVRSQVRPHS